MNRNEEVKLILDSRQIAEQQRREIKKIQSHRRKVQYLDNLYVRNALWPANKR